MGKEERRREPEITAAIISVIGTLVGTLLISVFLGFLEGRLGLGPVVAVIALLLVLSIWGLLAFRWGIRVAGAAAAAMVIVGSVLFLIAAATRIIPFGLPGATPVAVAGSPTSEPMATATPAPLPPTPTAFPAEEPHLSLAGDCRIAYEQDGDIYVRNCDGSGVYQVTDHPAVDGSPAWSPDGQRIVFASERDREPWPEGWTPASLYIVDADGSNLTRLTYTDDNDHGPSWSPDGSRIAFHRNCMLAIINSDGSDLRVILEAIGEKCVENPMWSPDGQRLAFVGGWSGAEAGDDLMARVVKADGSGLLKLDEFYGKYAAPAWSADGSQIAVRVWKPEGDEYYRMMNADGSGESMEIASIPESWYPWYWPQWGGPDQARAFVEPILAAIADRPPDFSEDFSDAASGWDVGMEGGGERGYVDGEYFILAPPAEAGTSNCTHGGWGQGAEFSDFVLEVDGRFLSGNVGDWQVHFRNGPEGFYAVHLALDGKGDVSAVRDKAMQGLAHFQAPPIRAGVEANTLQIIAQGSQIAVVVDGEPLAHDRDESFSGGTIILVVCNGGDTPLEVRFDNFEVWDILGLSL